MEKGNNVRVVCRFRPLNQKEIDLGMGGICQFEDSQTVTLKGQETHKFTFDRVFPMPTTQKEVFEESAKAVIEDILKGYNGTIFVYGQTSSGKTHTMQGPNIDDPELRGIIPRMNSTIFDWVMKADPNLEFLVKASYIEIYMEKIRDLLDSSKSNLKVREEKSKGIWVEGATEVYVSSEQDVLDVIRVGGQNRAIAATKMNFESSRSHSIFILTVSCKNLNDGSVKNGKLYLVDLAGSEKVEKTGAEGTVLDEAKMINKSLSALGNVINALTDPKAKFVPYRDSKLTRVLQESLGGNSRTTLIINCSPSAFNEFETLSTLRFGTRAKSIKNKAKVNQERSVAEMKILLEKFERENQKLMDTVAALEEEIRVLKGHPDPSHQLLRTGSTDSMQVVVNPSLPHVSKLQERCEELEAMVQKLEEEKQSAFEQYENTLEELREKTQDLLQVEQLKQELCVCKANEQTLMKENELLIVKLADIAIMNEKLQYDSTEHQLTIETLNAQNAALMQQINLVTDKLSETSTTKVRVHSEEPTKSDTSFDQEQFSKIKSEMDAYKRELESLKNQNREKEHLIEVLKLELKSVASFTPVNTLEKPDQAEEPLPSEPVIDSNENETARLERELRTMKDQMKQKLQEFDGIKAALLKDLENRCIKVVDLEILLDEAREQYETLLVQVKSSNSKTLQQKCLQLQKSLEQLGAAHQQLLNENNRLKLENQVYVKQINIRNERIHGLELLLKDTQEKFQKYASNELQHGQTPGVTPSQTPSAPSTTSAAQSAALRSGTANPVPIGGRIAKPLRGGGTTAAPGNNNNSSSLLDLFRSKNTAPASPQQKS